MGFQVTILVDSITPIEKLNVKYMIQNRLIEKIIRLDWILM